VTLWREARAVRRVGIATCALAALLFAAWCYWAGNAAGRLSGLLDGYKLGKTDRCEEVKP
jgi:hypothetical protein